MRWTVGEMVTNAASAATKSWRTSVPGVAAFLVELVHSGAALLDSDPTTVPNWALLLSLGAVAFGLLRARDHEVSSESAGAK